MTSPPIFVAVPVFNGAETVAETLRSIRDQTFENFRVLISIDGNDQASAEACRPFATDPRFSFAVQPQRLGWVGNLNWLVEHCDCPYFCYWQQDDLTATNYLQQLLAELLAHPEAAIAYSDIQWFGARFGRDSAPSIDGSPGSRVLQVIEAIHYAPLRGLMRADWLPRRGAIPATLDEGSHAEFVFLARMAARGGFHRVDGTLYFKRAHKANTFARWHAWPPFRRRRVWIEMGTGLWQVARQVLPEPRHARRLLATILDRLSIPRRGRGFFYQPDSGDLEEMGRFARDFLARIPLEAVPLAPGDAAVEAMAAFFPPIHPHVEAGLESLSEAARVRREMADRLRGEGHVTLAIEPGATAVALLGAGWSATEPWGVWNDGDEATLLLPPVGPGDWRLMLTGHHFADPRRPAGTPVRVAWRLGSAGAREVETLRAGEETTLNIGLAGLDSADVSARILYLHFPDSVFLPETGGDDQRQVGFGLRRMEIARSP